ncbi:hypothetical protein LTS15_007226 [Exophiala xenobiotica]|nr:hypothetical protein LTS15_007226 [Exophiala xenobiotica]
MPTPMLASNDTGDSRAEQSHPDPPESSEESTKGSNAQETVSEELVVQAQLWITSIQEIPRTSALASSSADPPIGDVKVGRNLRRFQDVILANPAPTSSATGAGITLHRLVAGAALRPIAESIRRESMETWLEFEEIVTSNEGTTDTVKASFPITHLDLDDDPVVHLSQTLKVILERLPVPVLHLPSVDQKWLLDAALRIAAGPSMQLELTVPRLAMRGDQVLYEIVISGFDPGSRLPWTSSQFINVPSIRPAKSWVEWANDNGQISLIDAYTWRPHPKSVTAWDTTKFPESMVADYEIFAKLIYYKFNGWIGREKDCTDAALALRGFKSRTSKSPISYMLAAGKYIVSMNRPEFKTVTYISPAKTWLDVMSVSNAGVVVPTQDYEYLHSVLSTFLTAVQERQKPEVVWALMCAAADGCTDLLKESLPPHLIISCSGCEQVHICPGCLKTTLCPNFVEVDAYDYKVCLQCRSLSPVKDWSAEIRPPRQIRRVILHDNKAAKDDMSETEEQALIKERDEAIAERDNVRRTAREPINRLENERDTIASERELRRQKAQPSVHQTQPIDRLAQERDALVLERDKLERDVQVLKEVLSSDNTELSKRLEEVIAVENDGVKLILTSLQNAAGSGDSARIYEVFWEKIMRPRLLQEEDPTAALKLNHERLVAATIKEKVQGPRQSVQSSRSHGLSPTPTPSVPAPSPWAKAESLSSGGISPAAIERPTTPHTTIRRGAGDRPQQEEQLPSSSPIALPSREKREGSSKRGLTRHVIFADQSSSTPKRRQNTHMRSQLTKDLFVPLEGLPKPPSLGLTDQQKQLPALPGHIIAPSSAPRQGPHPNPTKSFRRRTSTANFRAPTASSLARSHRVRQKQSTIPSRPSAPTGTPSRSDHSSSPTKGRSGGKGLLRKFGFTSKSGSKAGGEKEQPGAR